MKNEIIEYFLKMFGVTLKSIIKIMPVSDNHIYAYEKDKKRFILRITEGSRRSRAELEAEVVVKLFVLTLFQFIRFLKKESCLFEIFFISV